MTSPSNRVMLPEMLLEVFDEPIVIPRAYVALTGGLTPALFLSALVALTQDLGDQSDLPGTERGWIVRTQTEWRELTFLTRYEQEAARRALDQRGFITQSRRQMPARLAIRLEAHKVAEALRQQAISNYGALISTRPACAPALD